MNADPRTFEATRPLAPMRYIKKRVKQQEEHESRPGGRSYSWWVVFVTTLTLSCGHKAVYRGSYIPKKRVRCKACGDSASRKAA